MAIHWFYSLGNNPSEAEYFLANSQPPVLRRARFVLPALIHFGWPVSRDELSSVRFHMLGTSEVAPGSAPFNALLEDVSATLPEICDMIARGPTTPTLDRRDVAEIWRVVRAVLDRVIDGDTVVIELTNGIRSITTGFLLATGLLRAYRKDVIVRAVTYAEFSRPPGTCPVHDLLPFFELFEWSQALKAMEQYLDPGPLQRLAAAQWEHNRQRTGSPDRDARSLLQPLDGLVEGLALNWPIAVSRTLRTWDDRLAALGSDALAKVGDAPEIALLHLRSGLQSLLDPALLAAATANDDLTQARLEFDLRLIRLLASASRHADAARAIREWIVNAAILASGDGSHWLDQGTRSSVERRLHTASRTPPVSDLGRLWNRACDFRNAVSHLKYNRKHFASGPALAKFVVGAPDALRALQEQNAFALPGAVGSVGLLANAFSLNMIARGDSGVAIFESVELATARELARGCRSVVGHEETATLFMSLLGQPVATNRETVTLTTGDWLLVGQYRGPRLTVGATVLPDGASVDWIRVAIE